ncbi:insecticidal toxin complex protein TccC [Pseudomonas sp. GGS8]|uniref:RHS repeat-associated core domain-containing protein n=1 Tax=Pseudomonas sp. GGS8 TaxID=2817892 RepID=UPI0020A09DAE|nr:RHS repeat-associated core domain-containing protein [Pseudomonas sp. GGS8]MCP1441297.1 insecticidal toxin complex protein TccC [Pseudomonas sp. GGS8]
MSGSVHWRTPSVSVTDPRGLVIRQVEYLRKVAGDEVKILLTRQQYDNAGRLAAQRDPRLPTPNTSTLYGLDGQPLKVYSVDAGVNLNLPGLSAEPMQSWDARGNHRRMSYDNQMRVLAIEENAVPNVQTFTYADASADSGHNLRGQMTALKEPSGRVDFHSFGLTGAALRETRTFHDARAFVSRRTFSPLGTVLEQIDAGENKQQSISDVAGQLRQVKLQLKDQSDWQTVLRDAQFNAAGQIIEQVTGNGVTSRWLYGPADGRLHRQIAQKDPTSVLQDFEYQYDRMGNITAILDHVFTPTFFANQRVDGNRTFTYDSLSRLRSATGYSDAPPSDNPGRPQPTDPNDRRNYTQSYEYDNSDNLFKTTHTRDGASHTSEMFIDSASNRGVRHKPGDPSPDLDTLFDPAGNMLALQPGQRMHWNSRGQLETVTLVDRNGSGPDDAEHYRYSQGERVYKRHETYTTKTSHFHEVRYLPGLQIRTKDSGEELHVITLPGGRGSVRCLHWVSKKPDGIEQDQLRYSVDDHLGSIVMELDQNARVVSREGYYPFGGTAWLIASSALEISYKTIRYSAKEMDECGLYYYGARYYAPWLWRWVSADPAGPVDGPNLFAFVRNNPLNYFDEEGEKRTSSEQRAIVDNYETLLATVETRLDQAIYQLSNLHRTRDIYKSGAKRFVFTTINLIASAITAGLAATAATAATAFTGPAAPILGVGAGIVAADVTGNALDKVAKKSAFGYPLLPKADDFDVDNIVKEATPSGLKEEVKSMASKYDPRTTDGQKETAFAAVINTVDTLSSTSHLEKALALFRLSTELTEALNGTLGLRDLDVTNQSLETLSDFLDTQKDMADEALAKLESSIAMHKAEVAGTRHRLGATEIVVKAKMQRVFDLNHRLAQRFQKQQAA